jgi:multiple sugar transport system permease protein
MSTDIHVATVQSESRMQRLIGVGRIGPKWFPLFMLLPAFVFVLIVTGFPLLYSLYVSFTPYELLKPASLSFELSTALRNYERLAGDAVFWRSLGNTLLFLAVTVNLEYILALGLSQLLARVTYGQGLMRTLLMIPMMFAPILVGFQFRWFFNVIGAG